MPTDQVSQLNPGDPHYRAYVGNPKNYDLIAAITFNLLTTLGLREDHSVLDVGCGSLRNGRLLIPYLAADKYSGIEPNQWLVEQGIEHEVGRSLLDIKRPFFSFRADCAELADDARFDFVLLQSIFSHCGWDSVHEWTEQLAKHLTPRGLIVGTFSRHPSQTDNAKGWVYPGLVNYKDSDFLAILTDYGLHSSLIDWPHPIQQWFISSPSADKLAYTLETGTDFRNMFRRYAAIANRDWSVRI